MGRGSVEDQGRRARLWRSVGDDGELNKKVIIRVREEAKLDCDMQCK